MQYFISKIIEIYLIGCYEIIEDIKYKGRGYYPSAFDVVFANYRKRYFRIVREKLVCWNLFMKGLKFYTQP